MQAIRACVAATVRRDLKEPVAPVERSHEERVTFRWRRFLLLTFLALRRKFATGSAGDKKSTPLSESGTTSCGEERKIPQPETYTHSDTSNYRSRSGSVQTTTNGRLGDADLGMSTSYRTKSVSRECIPGMDDVSVMWSTLESKDGPGRHSGEDRADNRSTSIDTSLSRVCINDATTTNGKQNGDILRMQSVSHLCKRVVHTSHTMESRVSPSTLMFNSSAHGGASDGIGLRFGDRKRASQC